MFAVWLDQDLFDRLSRSLKKGITMLEFYFICFLYFLLFFIRIYLSQAYSQDQKRSQDSFDEASYTVIQPILSGHAGLKEDLRANLEASHSLEFFWVLDRGDQEAEEVVREILDQSQNRARVRLFFLDPAPQAINPKVYKIQAALEEVRRPYLIVLDDDTVLDPNRMNELHAYQREDVLVSGLAYHSEGKSSWSRLLAGFINEQSFLTDLSLAQMRQNKQIRGNFYSLSTKLAQESQCFKAIETSLCDHLALADFMRARGVSLAQSLIPCMDSNRLHSARSYHIRLRRWLVFSNFYMRKQLDWLYFLISYLPSMLALILVIWSLFLPSKHLIIFLAILLGKELILYAYRSRLLSNNLAISEIFFNLIAELILPFFLIESLVSPHQLIWRGKRIRLAEDGSFHSLD